MKAYDICQNCNKTYIEHSQDEALACSKLETIEICEKCGTHLVEENLLKKIGSLVATGFDKQESEISRLKAENQKLKARLEMAKVGLRSAKASLDEIEREGK